MTARYEVHKSDSLGRYLVAAKDLKAGETILSDQPFVLGPQSESGLVCFDCYQPLLSKFHCCKNCAVTPICPDGSCPSNLTKWHNNSECDFFANLKAKKGSCLSPFTLVQNVGSLIVLRALLKRKTDPQGWEEFMKLEMHLEERRGTDVWEFCEETDKFIKSLELIESEDSELVQKVCAAIDVNSFEVRGPAVPGLGCSELLRSVYLQAALIAHDCVANTHMSISENNVLVCHASTDLKKGDTIYYNYSDSLKGTAIRQKHLLIGKYFQCTCKRCADPTEIGTYISSAICPSCKTGYISEQDQQWACHSCKKTFESSIIEHRVQCCSDKLGVINNCDEKELEEYIRNVSLVLAPNHYLLLEAKQRLAGVLRDVINREPHPTKKVMKRKIQLCEELLPVLETLTPGMSRTKAITLYELHATMVQLAKKLFDAREITGSGFMDVLTQAEKHLRRALEMLFIEPGNSPEGELCAKALEEYRALKASLASVLDALLAEGKTCVSEEERSEAVAAIL